ncbi:MAG: hypothetical protein ACOCU2_02750 [Bacillota bacterium]
MKNIIAMLPFLDTSSKDELVESILNKEITNLKHVTPAIYPFLNNEQMHKLYQAAMDETIDADPYLMLPFLDEKTLADMVEKVESGDYGSLKVNRIMPFLSEKHLNRLFKHFMKHMKDEPEDTTNQNSASASDNHHDDANTQDPHDA